jgi:hypothetical protein
MGSLGTDEEEDDYDDLLMKDPPSGWDIFDDYHKFEQMELKRKEKRKESAREEMKILEMKKLQVMEQEEQKDLEKDILSLENKLKVQEESLRRKSEREDALLTDLGIFKTKI